MRKFAKIVCTTILALTLGLTAMGCAAKTVEVKGEYSHVSYGTTYGAKVQVAVQKDVVKKVTMLHLGTWVDVTASWTAPGKQAYIDNLNSMLEGYVGHKVDEIMSWTVGKDANHAPTTIAGADEQVLTSGATQSSGRLLLAVQNALEQLPNVTK